jgi:hypothetical protein
MWFGLLELGFLSCLAVVAALAICLRGKREGRAELAVCTGILAHALICFPVLFLGWTNLLYRSTLALTSLFVSSLGLGLSFLRRPAREHISELRTSAISLLAMPWDGLVLAWRHRSIGFVGLAACAASIGYTMWLSYLAPSSSWDGLWYHESIVGFALQNHGFGMVEVPQNLTYANSFPRVCESMNIWFVAFVDRRLVEIVTSFVSPLLILSFYVLARRYTGKIAAMSWASGFFLMPGILLQLRSTYIDTHIAALLIPAFMFATRPTLRLRDAWLGFLATAMVSGTKGHAVEWVPVLFLVMTSRLFWQHRKGRLGPAILTTVGGICLILLVFSPQYVRNWLVYKNPIYPIAIDIPRFKLHLPGYQRLGDLDHPWSQTFHDNYSAHTPGHDFADTQQHQFGLGFPWVVLPIDLIALPIAIVMAVRAKVFGPKNPKVVNLLILVLPILATLPISPAAWALRYNVHVAAALVLIAVWAGGRPGMRLFDEGASAIMIMTSIMMLYWSDPGWGLNYDQGKELAGMTAKERACYAWAWHTVTGPGAEARERELGPGDVVVFTDNNTFPSILWNERYSNRVVYVPFRDPEDFLRRVAEKNAKWVVSWPGTGEIEALRSRPNDWEEVGVLARTQNWTAYRRRR